MDQEVKVGIIGDYDPHLRYHIATEEALSHAAVALSLSLKSSWIETQSIAHSSMSKILNSFHALWCSPGSPYKSMDGALRGIQFARERRVPFIGT